MASALRSHGIDLSQAQRRVSSYEHKLIMTLGRYQLDAIKASEQRDQLNEELAAARADIDRLKAEAQA